MSFSLCSRLFHGFTSVFLLLIAALRADTSVVSSPDELEQALRRARPGDTIRLRPGTYRESVYVENLAGERDKPITVCGEDPDNPPVFDGVRSALHLSRVRYVTLRHLAVKGATANGINIDDGGRKNEPSHHVVLEDLTVSETGPTGNRDALKLSGVDHFVVRRCRLTGWGGSGIDMVGCHQGVVESCRFEGMSGFSQSNAVQMKGGTSDILVQANHFQSVGQRSVNIGGSTGLDYFRPEAGDYEATRIEVAGNRFEGSLAPINWVTTKGGWVHHNTIIHPEKWVARILQENTDARFKPSGDGLFEKNVVVTDQRVRTFVNVGGNTAPESFVFRDNAWFTDSPRRPTLPVDERGGRHAQIDDAFDLERALAEQAEAERGAAAYALQKPDWMAWSETEAAATAAEPLFQCDFEAGD